MTTPARNLLQRLAVDDHAATGDLRVVYLDVGDRPDRVPATLERTHGMVVETYATRDDAVAAVETGDVDCLVCGHAPPALDGFDVFETVRTVASDFPFVLYPTDGEADGDRLADLLVWEHVDVVTPTPDDDRVAVLGARIERLVRTYQRERRAALRDRAVEQTDVGITIARNGDDEPLIYVNRGFEAMTGYDAAMAVGRNCRFLQGPDTDEETVAEIRRAIDAGESTAVDIKNYRADGEPFWNHLDISPVTDDEGTVTHFFGFQRDVTERKRLERDLKRQNERLEQFTSVVSHDLRNPLSVVETHLQALRDGDEADIDHLGAALEGAERARTLVDELLDLAREGSDVDEMEATPLRRVASDAWGTVDAPAATLSVDDDVGTVRADPERLRTLFENLFRNAVEHGRDDVTVRIGRVREDGRPVGFFVADDGPGIPPDDRETVFDRGMTTAPDGTGFGLAIVDAIVDAHGWSIRVVESEAGGARFEVTDVDVVPDVDVT